MEVLVLIPNPQVGPSNLNLKQPWGVRVPRLGDHCLVGGVSTLALGPPPSPQWLALHSHCSGLAVTASLTARGEAETPEDGQAGLRPAVQ